MGKAMLARPFGVDRGEMAFGDFLSWVDDVLGLSLSTTTDIPAAAKALIAEKGVIAEIASNKLILILLVIYFILKILFFV